MFEPGDGRVTRRSLLGQGVALPRNSALYDTTLPLAYVAFTCELHSELPNNKTCKDNALTLLFHELTN